MTCGFIVFKCLIFKKILLGEVNLAGKETGNGLSKNIIHRIIMVLIGLDVMRFENCEEVIGKTLTCSLSSVILELLGRRNRGAGSEWLNICFMAFQSEPFVVFKFKM